MQFMVMSRPTPSRPTDVRGAQASFWDWLQKEKQAGLVKACYVRAGRGAILVFDVDTHETLHRLMTEWANCIPARFEVIPLIDPGHQEAIARKATTGH